MHNESGEPVLAINSNRSAKIYLEQALSQGLIEATDGRLPRIITGLGNSFSQLGKLDDALDLQLQALERCRCITEQFDQPVSDVTAIVQLNWGFLLCRRGELEAAEEVLRATLDAAPTTAPAMYALGNTYLAQGKVDEALAQHVRGLQVYNATVGDEHALAGRCLYKIGEILFLNKKDSRQAV